MARKATRQEKHYRPLEVATTLPGRVARAEEDGADGGSAEADDGGFISQASSAHALRLVAVSTFGLGVALPDMLRGVNSRNARACRQSVEVVRTGPGAYRLVAGEAHRG